MVGHRQGYAGTVIEGMRPGVRSEHLEVMPELLLELELESVVVGVVVIGDDVQILEVGIAPHGGREHLVTEKVAADVTDVGELDAAIVAEILLEPEVPHVDAWIAEVRIEGVDIGVRGIEGKGDGEQRPPG